MSFTDKNIIVKPIDIFQRLLDFSSSLDGLGKVFVCHFPREASWTGMTKLRHIRTLATWLSVQSLLLSTSAVLIPHAADWAVTRRLSAGPYASAVCRTDGEWMYPSGLEMGCFVPGTVFVFFGFYGHSFSSGDRNMSIVT
jgi:hypothetical protein